MLDCRKVTKMKFKQSLKNALPVVALLTIGTFIFIGFADKTNPTMPTTKKPFKVSSALENVPKTPRQIINSPSAGKAKDQRLSLVTEQYTKATDLRAFVEFARQHPELGGLYYADKVLRDCGASKNFIVQEKDALKYDTQRSPELYAKRQRAFELLRNRCQSFSSEELSAEGRSRLRDEALRKQDAFWKLDQEKSKASSAPYTKERSELARGIKDQIILTKDPLFLQGASLTLNSSAESNVKSTLWLDGKAYESSEDTLAFFVAWKLVPCSFGLVCDQTNHDVVVSCVQFDRCANSLEDLFRLEIEESGEAGRKQFAKVLDFKKRISAAIEKGDVAALSPR